MILLTYLLEYRAGDFVVVKFQAKKSVMRCVADELMKMTTECDDRSGV